MEGTATGARQPLWALITGPALFAATLVLPPPAHFSAVAWPTLGLLVWMAVWWMAEAVPLAVTALLPLAVVPLLGLPSTDRILAEYANASVFLILGGCLIGIAMERWNLHKRIAYNIVARVGNHPHVLVLGMMVATAFVSMWVSNASTTLMMLPVATAIAAFVAAPGQSGSTHERNFARALILSVGPAATIGGLGTLIGTPGNALVQGFLAKNYGYDLSFLDWLSFGVPTVLVLLPLCWWALVRFAFPFQLQQQSDAQAAVRAALAELGPMSVAERRVAVVAACAAVAWIARPLLNEVTFLGGLTDTGISIIAGTVLFLMPAPLKGNSTLLELDDLRRVPWNVLLLFGGGLVLAAAVQASTLDDTIGVYVRDLGSWPLLPLLFVLVAFLLLWTELASNVAAIATFIPVIAALAETSNHSVLALVVPAAIAASAGFMLPVGTLPNAIVLASGQVTLREMIRAGIWLDAIGIVVITAIGYWLIPLVSG